MAYRIGIDLGGTKTEIILLAPDGTALLRRRVPTPVGYAESLAAIAGLVRSAEAELGHTATVGVGIPGTISPATGKVQNANSNALNGHAFDRDLSAILEREVRVANDANCFALSEAVDGAAAGAAVVFGVILGTGCGAGIAVHKRILEGRHRIAGEFGHTPLPWPRPEEMPLRRCWCGQAGCLELYLAGPALAAECDGEGARDATQIVDRAAAGDERARAALRLHADRLARALAVITNILDPDAIVLGGGLSNLPGLAENLPGLMKPYIFADHFAPNVVRNKHGDSSGVRGAAWLWPDVKKEAAF
ncbi:MAG TPA: ROK family protein [Acidocella sp.]|jgi:fructokinase|uniref:ROK family protein n=1 Tax=Acidocella sp. TaxID=50710 RepID=UPI002BA58C4A|nr:ROK family protein [Acidocella sp.]HVE21955.1 ROK family protein [Acidocella sp.]